MARLKEFYRQQVVPALMQELGYTNLMQVPRLQKIVANMGLGSAVQNPKILESGVSELTLITGQKPIVTRAHTSIANFKLREGVSIGCAVTLHGERMYEFFDRLVSIALPRVRDFRGVSENAFDGRGNYSLGIREHVIFPELNLDKVEQVKGFTVSLVTTARTDAEGRALLRALGMPLRS
ncbi:MAG: 50S ribosomal protein L5 [Deltaproteobacteria bacterium]|nr:MAG: 50S ribosomal protein L5 [Deltaproteobacteria bacterium]